MKIVSYTALHYGSDYLGWAIRSVIDYVDEHHVLYSPVGSHGHRTSQSCPDTRNQLYAIASEAAGDKLRWHEGLWAYEGEQRGTIHAYAPDADVILVVDADEIWGDGLAESVVDYSRGIGVHEVHPRKRLPIIHYWRSFHRAVLHDPAYPIRVIYPKANPAHGEGPLSPPFVINHMGYAQRSEVVEYKQHTHGHKGEWRKDIDWFRERFLANAQEDCHPVGSDYWNPEPVDPWHYLPEFMKEHPYAGLEVIP